MRISDWSSDVCSSDLLDAGVQVFDFQHGFNSTQSVGAHLVRNGIAAKCIAPRVRSRINRRRLLGSPHATSSPPPLPPSVSEERRVGKGRVRRLSSRWTPYHSNKNRTIPHKHPT